MQVRHLLLSYAGPSPAALGVALCLALGPRTAAAPPALETRAVVNIGDFSSCLCSGIVVSITGTNLASAKLSSSGLPLPNSLGGTSVQALDGNRTLNAPLFWVSPAEVRAQLPFDLASSTLRLRVRTADGEIVTPQLPLSPYCPRVLSQAGDPAGPAAVFHGDDTPVTAAAPALPGEKLRLHAVGLGAVSPAMPAGARGSMSNRVATPVALTVGGLEAEVAAAGLVRDSPGFYQVEFVVPAAAAAGVAPLELRIGEQASQSGSHLTVAHVLEKLAAGTVGSEGGAISVPGLALEIPPGAFDAARELTVFRAAGDDSVVAQARAAYAIAGLPTAVSQPLALTFELPEAPAADAEFFVALRDRTSGRAEHWLKARLDGTRVIAELPPRTPSPPLPDGKPARAATAQSDGDALLVFLVTGLILHSSDRFEILFPREQRPALAAALVREGLDKAFDELSALGLGAKAASLLPILVRVMPMKSSSDEPWGDFRYASWYQQPVMRVNTDYFTAGRVEEKAAHLLLHLVQDQYFRETSQTNSHWPWMNEATATAFERKMSGSGSYVPDQLAAAFRPGQTQAAVFRPVYNPFVPYHHSLLVPGTERAYLRALGAALAPFIEHLAASEGGWRMVGDLYHLNEVPGAAIDPMDALRKRVSNLGGRWLEYIRKLCADDYFFNPVEIAEKLISIGPETRAGTYSWGREGTFGICARFFRFSLPRSLPKGTTVTIEPLRTDGVRLPPRFATIFRTVYARGGLGPLLGEGKLEITESNAASVGGEILLALVDTHTGEPQGEAFDLGYRVSVAPGPADPTRLVVNFRVPISCVASNRRSGYPLLTYTTYVSPTNRAQVVWRNGAFSATGLKTTTQLRETFDIAGTVALEPAPPLLQTTRTKRTSEETDTGTRSVIDFTLQKIPCEITSSRISCAIDERSLRVNPQAYVGGFTWEIFNKAGEKTMTCTPDWAARVWDSAHPSSIIQVLIE